jgi:Protein of unknown function (DUF2911)
MEDSCMLKRLALVGAALVVAVPAFAQNPRGEAKATVAGKAVTIDYGRPSLKGRDMLGQAQVGQSWRMGADAATSLKTDADLSFGDVKVPKGEYVLTATKLGADQWQLNVLSKSEERTKVADVPLTASKLDASVEQFTIDLKGDKDKGELKLLWGTTALGASFTGK